MRNALTHEEPNKRRIIRRLRRTSCFEGGKEVPLMKNYSQFHDGNLEGLWIDDTVVHVYLRTLEKERFVAVAEGVVALAASGFRAGNLIFEVVTRDHEEIASSDIAELYDLQEGSAGETQGAQLLEKARHEGLILLEINPSYGATCIVMAHSVDLIARNDWLGHQPVTVM
jgi:hypothetical protein